MVYIIYIIYIILYVIYYILLLIYYSFLTKKDRNKLILASANFLLANLHRNNHRIPSILQSLGSIALMKVKI